MADKVSIECPACAARLNLADRTKLGKKIKCPKCSEVFVAEAPDDDELIEDEDDDEPKQPSSRKRGAADSGKGSAKGSKKGAGKGKSSEGSSNLPLIIGGVVALLGLVGGGLFFAGVFDSKPLPTAPAAMPAPMAAAPVQAPASPPPPPQISPAEKMLGLRWMPPETDLLIHAKLADIWQAPLLKEPLSSPPVTQGLEEFKKRLGMLPSDIESISFGIVDFSSAVKKSMNAGAMPAQPAPKVDPNAGAPATGLSLGGPIPGTPAAGGPPPGGLSPADIRFVVVMKTKKPMDLKQFSAAIPNA